MNRIDRWGGAPLDDAIRSHHQSVAAYLRSQAPLRCPKPRSPTDHHCDSAVAACLAVSGRAARTPHRAAWATRLPLEPERRPDLTLRREEQGFADRDLAVYARATAALMR